MPGVAVTTNGDPTVDGVTNDFVVDLVAALADPAIDELTPVLTGLVP